MRYAAVLPYDETVRTYAQLVRVERLHDPELLLLVLLDYEYLLSVEEDENDREDSEDVHKHGFFLREALNLVQLQLQVAFLNLERLDVLIDLLRLLEVVDVSEESGYVLFQNQRNELVDTFRRLQVQKVYYLLLVLREEIFVDELHQTLEIRYGFPLYINLKLCAEALQRLIVDRESRRIRDEQVLDDCEGRGQLEKLNPGQVEHLYLVVQLLVVLPQNSKLDK